MDLFTSLEKPKPKNEVALNKIEGLMYIPDFITREEHTFLWQSINAEKWLDDLKRRVQHYGYKYDYKSRFIDYRMKIGNLPNWSMQLANRFQDADLMRESPDQLIVNEYLPGQGIANHIDCEPCFGDTIISVSLGSACVMDFINKYSREKIEVLLEPRSAVILRREARHEWSHGIASRKTDIFANTKIERKTRISLTFRNIIMKY